MDNKKNIGSSDRDKINVNEDYELQYWSEKFSISRQQLKDAVDKAGTSVDKVKAHLKK